MVAMSQPLPLTHSTSTGSPWTSVSVVLTELLPPPASTRAGSAPARREAYTQPPSRSSGSGAVASSQRLAVSSVEALTAKPYDARRLR